MENHLQMSKKKKKKVHLLFSFLYRTDFFFFFNFISVIYLELLLIDFSKVDISKGSGAICPYNI